jgi:hypothetical protein
MASSSSDDADAHELQVISIASILSEIGRFGILLVSIFAMPDVFLQQVCSLLSAAPVCLHLVRIASIRIPRDVSMAGNSTYKIIGIPSVQSYGGIL